MVTNVPPVVPRSAGRTSAPPRASTPSAGEMRPLPAVELAALARQPELLCRIASVDSQGRVADQSVVRALGWSAGQRLDIRVISGSIVIRADAAGVFTLARRCHVPIPATVRRWCALGPRERVLLAVAPAQGALIIHTMATLEEMLRPRHAALLGGDTP